MKKKGFTLVELLAVIAILAILVIIALPNVMGMFNTAKKNSFTTEVKEVYKQAQQQWITDSLMSTGDITYYRSNGVAGCHSANASSCHKIDLTGRTQLDYYIIIKKNGKVYMYYVTDGTYQYGYNGGDLKMEEIGKNTTGDENVIKPVSEVNNNSVICIGGSYVSVNPSSTSSTACYSNDTANTYTATVSLSDSQTTLTLRLVDRNNNPVSGARVQDEMWDLFNGTTDSSGNLTWNGNEAFDWFYEGRRLKIQIGSNTYTITDSATYPQTSVISTLSN